MRSFECASDITAPQQHLPSLNFALREEFVQPVPGDIVHRDVCESLILAIVQDPNDVRMTQPSHGSRFLPEPRHELGVGRVLRVKDLDRDQSLDRLLPGQEDDAHATLTQSLEQTEVADALDERPLRTDLEKPELPDFREQHTKLRRPRRVLGKESFEGLRALRLRDVDRGCE